MKVYFFFEGVSVVEEFEELEEFEEFAHHITPNDIRSNDISEIDLKWFKLDEIDVYVDTARA